MANGDDISNAIVQLFSDAGKNISDLKAREWQATTLAIAGIAGIISIARSPTCPPDRRLPLVFMALVVLAHAAVMWRCHLNLETFRDRLKKIIAEKFPSGAQDLFKEREDKGVKKRDYKDAVADEGTIESVAVLSVWLAFAFGLVLLK